MGNSNDNVPTAELEVRYRIWLERGGTPFFGDGRAALLQAIREQGTLTAAARSMGMSYRTAWRHLNAIEQGLGWKVVVRRTGGRTGGGCKLTPDGEQFLDNYRRFAREFGRLRDACFREYLQ